MKLLEVFSKEELLETRMVWKRRGKKIIRAVRCTSGPRTGRVVSNASQCTAPIDIKKRMTFRKTKAKLGSRMARKSKRTKRMNPASIKLRTLNKR